MGSEWREQLPLNALVPYPTATIAHSSVNIGITSAVFIPVVSGSLLWWFGASPFIVATVVSMVALAVVFTTVSRRRGPIEWLSFGTYYPGKSIYFFRNTGDLEFDAFGDRLRDAIIAAGGSCGIDSDAD